MRYTKKSVTIEAIRFVSLTELGDPYFDLTPNGGNLPAWLLAAISAAEGHPGAVWVDHSQLASLSHMPGRLCIGTLEGVHTASDGDWIIRGVKGELYPCKPDIFEATYDVAAEAVEWVPPLNEETAADFLARLGLDGRLWAEEFCRMFESHVVREKGHGVVDVALMTGWFANAIEAGRDRGRAQGWKEDAPYGNPRQSAPDCPVLEAFHESGVALLDQPGTFTIGHGFGTVADSDGSDGA